MPTGLAFRDGALYVVDIDKLIRYDNAEANLDNLGTGKVVYDEIRDYPHGWKYIAVDKDGSFIAVRAPLQHRDSTDQPVADPPRRSRDRQRRTGGARRPQQRRRRRRSAQRQVLVHRKCPRLISDDIPSDKLNMISKLGEHFGYPYCHQGNIPDPKFQWATNARSSPGRCRSRRARGSTWHEVLHGDQFPAEYKNNIFIAEHGSWNRAKYQGAGSSG